MEAQAPVDCEKQYSNQRDGNAVRPRKSCSPRESGVPLIDIHWSSMVAEVRRWVCRCQEWLPHACRACARLPAASSVIGKVRMKLSSGVSSVFVSFVSPARVSNALLSLTQILLSHPSSSYEAFCGLRAYLFALPFQSVKMCF